MIRPSLMAVACMAMSACVTVPNDVAEGVGFQDYQVYEARRAMLRGDHLTAPQPQVIQPPVTSAAASPVIVAATPSVETQVVAAPAPTVAPTPDPLTQVAAAAIAEAETAPSPAPVTTAAPAPAPAQVELASAPLPQTVGNSPEISDEQEFDAVAARETIESDAERLAQMQAARVEVAPTPLPSRPASTGPNIIDYALSTTHPVGERRYSRNPIGRNRHEANCLAFRSPDLAQEWFLANSGPTRDRRALDPDGDGYACAWDPEIYRAAARAARN